MLLAELFRSFAGKVMAAALIFAVVPVLISLRLQEAEAERHALLLRLVQDQGRLVGEAMFPLLAQFSPKTVEALVPTLERLSEGRINIKVLFRPAAAREARSFLFVAAAPMVGADDLQRQQAALVTSGVLGRLADSCQGQAALALRLGNPSGDEELLTNVTPRMTPSGCWVVLTSLPGGLLREMKVDRPPWQAPEVRTAAVIYLLMAGLILSIFVQSWYNLGRFREVARALRRGAARVSFREHNRIPELAEVAEEFDALVASLARSERALRQMAEDNAHALKAPLAVISQCQEPLRRAVPPEAVRARRALDLIAQSVERLDGLIASSRRMDEAIAALIDCPRHRFDLSAQLTALAAGHGRLATDKGLRLTVAVPPAIRVTGGEEMVETIVENLLDNAFGFTPPDGEIRLAVTVDGAQAVLSVEDEGPGVAAADLERIFERHVSSRAAAEGQGDAAHFGLGLWIVRRNAEAMGGRAWAENRPDGGLRVAVALPLA